jgi:predicted RNA binding protein YcfA (HicA-like mRNA interferase family)
LIKKLKDAGFIEIGGAGKGSHRKFTHEKYPGAVTISGSLGDDAKQYQVKQVNNAIERVKE